MATNLGTYKPISSVSTNKSVPVSQMPLSYQQGIANSGTISTPPKQNLLQQIQSAVQQFFGTDISSKIQVRYDALVRGGVNEEKAGELAVKMVQPKNFWVVEITSQEYNSIPELAKKELSKIGRKEMADIAFGFMNPTSGMENTITQIAKEKSPQIIEGILSKMGFAEDVAKQFAPKLAKETTESGVSKIIQSIPKIEQVIPTITTKVLTPAEEVSQKISQGLKNIKPLRGVQETIYSAERSTKLAKAEAVGKKVSGEAGFYEQLGALKGELSKVQFDSLRNTLDQKTIDTAFNLVKESSVLEGFDKITASNGLRKLFGEAGTTLPTENELYLLSKVFPKEMIDTLLSKRPLIQKIRDAGIQLGNISKSVMSSYDLSFGGRQGIFLAPTFTKEWGEAFASQFKNFTSEEAYKLAQQIIVEDPLFKYAKASGISFTDIGQFASKREEAFMSTWAEKIPGIRASARAYTGMANKLRMDTFKAMFKNAELAGLKPAENPDLLKSMGKFINVATGRGGLGSLEKYAVELNTAFFSPRLMSSRLSLMNPFFYASLKPFVRKQALKSLLAFGGMEVGILALLASAGANVGTDARSTDFGKVKVGNTRIDIGGGFQQYIVRAAQLLSGQYTSSTTGKTYNLGEGYKPTTRYDILLRLGETKESPAFSFATDLLKGQTYNGQPIDLKSEIATRFVPMVIQDLYDIAKDDPDLLPLGLLGIVGAGIQTYTPTNKKTTTKGGGGGNLGTYQPISK